MSKWSVGTESPLNSFFKQCCQQRKCAFAFCIFLNWRYGMQILKILTVAAVNISIMARINSCLAVILAVWTIEGVALIHKETWCKWKLGSFTSCVHNTETILHALKENQRSIWTWLFARSAGYLRVSNEVIRKRHNCRSATVTNLKSIGHKMTAEQSANERYAKCYNQFVLDFFSSSSSVALAQVFTTLFESSQKLFSVFTTAIIYRPMLQYGDICKITSVHHQMLESWLYYVRLRGSVILHLLAGCAAVV